MKKNSIEVMAIQETRETNNKQILTKEHTWYFPGNQTNIEHHGVGMIIRNELRNYVKDVIPINSRLIILILRGIIPITIISTYAPTADKTDTEKDKYYNVLQNEIRKGKQRSTLPNGRLQRKDTTPKHLTWKRASESRLSIRNTTH